jgi:hypothetical protein
MRALAAIGYAGIEIAPDPVVRKRASHPTLTVFHAHVAA